MLIRLLGVTFLLCREKYYKSHCPTRRARNPQELLREAVIDTPITRHSTACAKALIVSLGSS